MTWEKITGDAGQPYEHQRGCYVWCIVCQLPVSHGYRFQELELGSGDHPGDFVGICSGVCAERAVMELETPWMGVGGVHG